MKKILTALFAVSVVCLAFATEVSDAAWVSNIPIRVLFVGDYNANGQAYIHDGANLYTWSLTTEYGRLMYATALTARALNKNVTVLRNPTAVNGAFQIYRIQL